MIGLGVWLKPHQIVIYFTNLSYQILIIFNLLFIFLANWLVRNVIILNMGSML